MSLTALRQGVQDELEADLGIRMVAGMLNGAQELEDIGCVWVAGVRERPDVQTEDIVLKARVFLQWKPTEPTLRDPAALEALTEAVQTSLRDKQTDQFGVWMFQLTEITIDLEDNGVEATIVAVTANPFSIGG